MKNKPAE